MKKYNNSYWNITSNYNNPNNKNIDNKSYDILIIGAGLTGINTAFLLMNKGYKIAVVDCKKIGYGTSSKSSANITIQHGLIYDYLIRNFGKEVAKNYYLANLDGLKFYENVINNLNIDCDLVKTKSILFSNNQDEIYDLKTEKEAYDKLNIESELINIYDMNFPIQCGLEIRNQYKFNPLKYLFSICNILNKNKIDIYENTMVYDIKKYNNYYKIYTNSGNVIANKVLICTNLLLKKYLKLIPNKIYQEKSYFIACKTNIKPFNDIYIGLNEKIHSLRFYKYKDSNILLLGGQSHIVGKNINEKNIYNQLINYVIKYFSKFELISSWSIQDNISLDKLPFIGQINKFNNNLFISTGYNKWGMTSTASAAIVMSNMIINNNDAMYKNIFCPYRNLNINLTSMQLYSKVSLNTFLGLAKKLIYHNKNNILNMNYQEGKIISSKIYKLGVYLDKNNDFHCIKPYCTYSRTLLKFNEIDKTWDCICHGSRYDIYGKVVYGPALNPLKYVKINLEKIISIYNR